MNNKLKRAIDYLKAYQMPENVSFDIEYWKHEADCGTTLCAGGILAESGEFNLKLMKVKSDYYLTTCEEHNRKCSIRAISTALDIYYEEAVDIFLLSSYGLMAPTLNDVIERMEGYLDAR